jgi:hypothetical protein
LKHRRQKRVVTPPRLASRHSRCSASAFFNTAARGRLPPSPSRGG